MSADPTPDLELELGHVLCIDIVGYSKLLMDDQRALQHELNQIVRSTEQFRAAESLGKLVRLPTGDGMALVFFTSPEAPLQCALQISEALLDNQKLRVRMGINTGPVSETKDVNNQSNIAGTGINLAQRVMALGDAGHILLSQRVAEDLTQYRQWQSHLHDLGEFELKHAVRMSVVNFYTPALGNSDVPEKLREQRQKRRATKRTSRLRIVSVLLLVVLLPVALLLWHRASVKKRANAPLASDKSVAVLPFENLSDDKQNSYFTDGVQDEILMDLAKIAELKVISRTSVMQYKSVAQRNIREIARQLGVVYILEGSVQRAANRVRVTAQLIDARNDSHLWANHYDRDVADVFAIQSEIAKAIADQLSARLSPSEKAAIEQPPTVDLIAFDLYSRAKILMLSSSFSARTKDNLLQAVELLNQAVNRDANFFQAYCQLTYAHDILYLINLDHTPARLALANAAVQAAQRLRPDAGETHLALAEHLYRAYLDYDHARAEIELAQRTLPNDPLIFELRGYIDRRQGHWEDSTRNFEREIEIDPRNLYVLQQISLSYQCQRRYREMGAILDRALTIAPADVDTRIARAQIDLDRRADPRALHAMIDSILSENPAAAPTLADAWLHLALCERDRAASAKAMAALPDITYRVDAVILERDFIEGLLARVRGDTAAARSAFNAARKRQEKLIRAQPDYGPALCMLGLIDAGLGHKEDALREGRQALELLPVQRDALNGPHMIELFAVICAWTGEKDMALEQLEKAAQLPGWLSYGNLRLHPFWDPLRGDARFDKIIASLAPKDSN